jgi:putative ATP-dependent endonuclease of OLD family
MLKSRRAAEARTMLSKIHIENFRTFRKFDLAFRDSLNIFVGNNDAGKTTLLEAIHLALTLRFRGRPLAYELSPHLINHEARDLYVSALAEGGEAAPPTILIDLFLEDRDDFAELKGENNYLRENAPGLRVRAAFSSSYSEEYLKFIADETPTVVPTEYFDTEWTTFAGNAILRRSVPVKASLIDASALRLHAGADYYLQKTIDEQLEPSDRVELSRVYRSLRETFSEDPAIAEINKRLGETQKELTDKDLSLSIDVSQSASWESGLVPHLEDLPLQFIGGGGQSMLKILLALNRSIDKSQVVLIEEPENHQSPSSLNVLVEKIRERCKDRQVFVSTHSSFVINKLGLDRLALLGEDEPFRLAELDPSTLDYFKKLPGFDTLRVVLANRIILAEGPSDELVLQRAYKDIHGKLPVEEGVDVISVRGLSAKRFLEIAAPLGKRVSVALDNDKKQVAEVEAAYVAFKDNPDISLHVSNPSDGRTLEPQLLKANDRATLNEIFGKSYDSDDALLGYMADNKTTCALRILENPTKVKMPSYIEAAVA